MIITATSRSNSSAKVRSVQCLFCRFWRTKIIFGLLFREGKEGRGQNDIRHVWFSRSEKKRKTTLVFGRCLFMTKCGIHFSVSHKNSGAGIGGTCYTWAFFRRSQNNIAFFHLGKCCFAVSGPGRQFSSWGNFGCERGRSRKIYCLCCQDFHY